MIDRQRKMKIAYVAKMFPRLSETFVLNEILELERQGAEIVVFSAKKPNEGQFHPQLANLRARIVYLEDLDAKKWAGWISREWDSLNIHGDRIWDLVSSALADGEAQRVELIWQAAWMANRATELGVERFHAHFATLPAMLTHLAHRVSGIPYSFTAHAKDIFVYPPEETRLGELIEHADFMVTVTEFNRRHLQDILPGLDRDKIKVIHNGIDLQNFQPTPFDEREDNRILAVGRLVPKKGFADLLDACVLLRDRGVDFRCTIGRTGRIHGSGQGGPGPRFDAHRFGVCSAVLHRSGQQRRCSAHGPPRVPGFGTARGFDLPVRGAGDHHRQGRGAPGRTGTSRRTCRCPG